MANVLCVDDDPGVLVVLEQALGDLGHTTTLTSGVAEATLELGRQPFDLILSDFRMPDATGLDLLTHVVEQGIGVPVILMTAYSTVEHAVASMKQGAADYLTKPLRAEALRLAVQHALEIQQLRRTNDAYRRELQALTGGRAVIGDSPAMREVLETVAAVAPTRATVLIEGESGTGKELIAHAIHAQSPRHDGPFVTVNCAALPEGLVESAMFGHERGAFTGATARSVGAFERAHGGTLLLDEISEMRLDLQAKLLRAIQEQEIERVGGSQPIKVDTRIVATTNRDLHTEVAAGRFRADLFYRLSVVPIHTPPLRAHLEDLPALVHHFVAHFAAQLGVRPPQVTDALLETLRERSWPGNVRELANAIERGVILQRNGRLTLGPPPLSELRAFGAAGARTVAPSAPPAAPSTNGAATAVALMPAPPATATLNLRDLEREAIERALAATGGHRTKAARLLGISERTLRSKLNTKPDANA